MITRPPIIVILGHVNHGKTTLLDYIRKTKFAFQEAGQITQHIGAYQITFKDKKITFIDTPGHEAFAKMRSRGANVADIAILVVAADDGVMPQTKEAIWHIEKAKIPMIVALNKIDLPQANLEKVKKQLVKEGIKLEEYGGDVVTLPISAKTGQGINDLLEMILLIAEMKKIEADPKGPLEASIIETRVDSRRGIIASIIVRNGTLRQGEKIFIEGKEGKVRAIFNERGERLLQINPGEPGEILGLEEIPPVGALLTREPKEKKEKLIEKEKGRRRENKLVIILKTDVLGSLEAIKNSLSNFPIEIVKSNLGEISEGDVVLAKTIGAIIIGFRVNILPSAKIIANEEKVIIKTYDVIYDLLEELKEAIEIKKKPPQEEFLGQAEILAEFFLKKGRIAGCRVIQGKISLGDQIKLVRKGQEIGRAKIRSLKKQKEAVSKVSKGEEFGVIFEPQLDFKPGDIVISLTNGEKYE